MSLTDTRARSTGAAEVVVVGSLNRDYVCSVEQLPEPGQTVLATELVLGSGGKGGNQAVAASRLGARTALVGRVGDDDDGRALCADLVDAGVDITLVEVVPGVRTGSAFVLVAADGENSIVVAAGANSRLSADQAAASSGLALTPASVLVTQAELPTSTLLAAISAAAARGCRAVVNLAPFQALPPDVLGRCDPLVVNQSEASALRRERVSGVESARRAADQLLRQCRSVVITLGALGAVHACDGSAEHVPAPAVPVLDTTGAGDAFTGALAASLSRGGDLPTAVRLGVRASSHSVSRRGAQASFPTLADLE